MAPKCPKCGSIIYSRRNVLCGVCGERLPAEFLFSEAEKQKVERDLQELKERHQAAKESDEAFEQEARLGMGKRVSRHYPLLGAIIRVFTEKRRRW